ncbi:MAG: very short patch repair endonuclease [Candidatus Rokuibacteriota bacterium]
MVYRKLPTSRRALAEMPLNATDPRNPAPSSLATRTVMVANVGRGTSPELALRRALRAVGARGYRVGLRAEGVRPDIVFTRQRVAVFVHGCFWHRCPTCRFTLPKTNREFWLAKFRRNRARDRAKRRQLERGGWQVVEVWEHEVRDTLGRVTRTIAERLGTGPRA